MQDRAYSILQVKRLDVEQRRFSGIASTPELDRQGHVIDPAGVEYRNPLPLLLHHDQTKPIGRVVFHKATAAGIEFDAEIPVVNTPGIVQDRTNEAWDSVRHGLIPAVSIGWKSFDGAIERIKGGIKFLKSEVLELSLVTIPANSSATIRAIKALDIGLAAPGTDGPSSVNPPGSAGTPVVRLLPSRREQSMKSTSEQIVSFESTRSQKWTEMQEIMTKSGESGQTLDESQSEAYDTLRTEIDSIDKHLQRLKDLEAFQKSAAVPVPQTPTAAPLGMSQYLSPSPAPVISVKSNLPAGIGFARSVMCQVQARLDQVSVVDVAKSRYPSHQELHQFLHVKASVPAGTTVNDPWASPLVDPTNLAGEFIEFLRPRTIVGRFGTDGIPSLRRVPFNVRITGQTSGGVSGWTGQGRAKPVTSFAFNAVTLLYTKIAAIAVITEELARFSTPSAETLVRDALAAAVIERMDNDFIDPAVAAVANVNPASITNGLTALSSSGATADNVRTDLINLLSAYAENNHDPSGLVLIMPNALALALSILTNSLGQAEFPEINMTGGRLKGLPVITSNYAANASGSGNLVIAVNANEVFLADDGQVRVDASREASIEMSDAPLGRSDVPTASSVSVVSMYQTNSIALRAERFVNWAKRRAEAVVYMDDVNWGSVGSPA